MDVRGVFVCFCLFVFDFWRTAMALLAAWRCLVWVYWCDVVLLFVVLLFGLLFCVVFCLLCSGFGCVSCVGFCVYCVGGVCLLFGLVGLADLGCLRLDLLDLVVCFWVWFAFACVGVLVGLLV